MSTELEQYHPPPSLVPALPPATDVDGWITVVQQVAMLAERIADTDFVPDAMRRKPAAITAAILAGREMGVAPMTALQHINVIKGKPGQDALLMRALVLAKGHALDYGDCSDTRALVRGKRRSEETWTEVVFTADQARRAKIDLGGYPEDKLIARATSRLCRRKFADVIIGLAYTLEELQDGDAEFDSGQEPPAPEPAAQRTAQRKPRTTPKLSAAPRGGAAAAPAAADQAPSGPPLPGEDDYDDAPAADHDTPTPQSTTAQNRKMHALFKDAEVQDRDERLKLTGLLLNRALDTSAGLTVTDATTLIDALVHLQHTGHPDGLAGAVTDLMNNAALKEAEAELAAEAHTEPAHDPDAEQ